MRTAWLPSQACLPHRLGQGLAVLALLAVGVASVAGQGNSPPPPVAPDPAPAIATGFLFVDGQYVEPPYSLTVADKRVLVNGVVCAAVTTAPAPRDPGPPPSTADGETCDLGAYCEQKYAYLQHVLPAAKAQQVYLALLHKLPGVKSVDVAPDGGIHTTFATGFELNQVPAASAAPAAPALDPTAAALAASAQQLRAELQGDQVVLLTVEPPYRFAHPLAKGDFLPFMLRFTGVLRSPALVVQKVECLLGSGAFGSPLSAEAHDRLAKELLRGLQPYWHHFRASPKLEERLIQRLQAAPAATP